MDSEETRSGNTQAVIPAGVEVQGQIKNASDIQIDGKLNGDLSCAGNAVIGNDASINGNMAVKSVEVSGSVAGNITAKERIELKSTARITGDIKAKRLVVEDGVALVGKAEVNPSGASSGSAAAASASEGSANASAAKGAAEQAGGSDSDSGDAMLQDDDRKGKTSSLFRKK